MSKLTGKELVEFARTKIGTPYVYGMKGKVMTQANFEYLQNKYGVKRVWNADENKVGQVCCDCSGLISWGTGAVRSSAGYKAAAKQVHPISTVATAPIGALVWLQGHIGIYIGNGRYIAEDGSAHGCRENSLSKAKFTHWFLCVDVDYEEEAVEVVERDKLIVDGKEFLVDMIRKDGVTYIKTRDFAEALGCKAGSQGRIPKIDKQ